MPLERRGELAGLLGLTIYAAPAQCRGRDRSDRWSQAAAVLQDFNIGAGEEVNMRIRWPGWPVVVALLVVCATMPAVAEQTWPQRTVKLIVPLGPGSGADIGARLMADRLSKRWGQPVIVENRPGGDAIPAITQFIGANDDHALFFAPSSVFIAHPFQYSKLSYDPAALIPVVKLSETLTTLSMPVVLNVSNLAGLVALAYKEPGKINWHALTSPQRHADASVRQVPQARHRARALSGRHAGAQ